MCMCVHICLCVFIFKMCISAMVSFILSTKSPESAFIQAHAELIMLFSVYNPFMI